MLQRAESGLRRTGDPEDTKLADGLRTRIEEKGDLPPSGTESQKVYPEISLDAEYERQAKILAQHFAKKLNMTEEEYIATLPLFPKKPASYDSLDLTVPLISEGKRIPWLEQANISDIKVSDYLKSRANELQDWREDPFGFVVPQEAFTTWIQDGTRFVNRKPRDVRGELTEDLRGGGIEEIISAVILRPDIVRGKSWDLIASGVGSDYVACLDWFGGRPMLAAGFDDHASPYFRSLVCGRKIGT